MSAILNFFHDYAFLIYLLLAIGLMFAIRGLLRGRREMGESVFGLERESAHRHTRQGVAAISLITILAIAEMALTVFLAPNLPAISLLGTPTMNPLITATTTIQGDLLATYGLTPVSIPTLQTTGCIPGQIMITYPKPGDIIKGKVTLIGTADIPNFGFYKYEFSPFGSEIWTSIQANHSVKQDTDLGNWDTGEVSPGDYNLRLVVIDNQGNILPPCIVPVRVAAP